MFFHWRFIWAQCFFNHLTKVRWKFELFKKWKIAAKKEFFYQPLLNYWCTFTQMYNYVLWFLLILKPKSFICDLKNNSKWVKSYVLLLLILYVIPNFLQVACTIVCAFTQRLKKMWLNMHIEQSRCVIKQFYNLFSHEDQIVEYLFILHRTQDLNHNYFNTLIVFIQLLWKNGGTINLCPQIRNKVLIWVFHHY
jgi:hypothetical protein